jgi:hypothetical protein
MYNTNAITCVSIDHVFVTSNNTSDSTYSSLVLLVTIHDKYRPRPQFPNLGTELFWIEHSAAACDCRVATEIIKTAMESIKLCFESRKVLRQG